MRDYKIVVLGAGGVGKSSLTVQFVQNVYIDTYDPTIEDSYRKQIEIDTRACDLEILDTAGVAQFTAMRELYIKSGRGFLLVYSVTDENSLKELLELREQVLRIKNGPVPMVLVGNKCDLDDYRELSPEEGIRVSESWGKVPFYETSAMLRTNVDEAFVDVVRQIMRSEVEESAVNATGTSGMNSNTNNNRAGTFRETQNDVSQSTELESGKLSNKNTNRNVETNQKNTNVNKSANRGAAGVSTTTQTIKKEKKKKKKSSCVIL